MTVRMTITVDDDDREAAPATPYTAVVVFSDPDTVVASGIGATPADALADLAVGLRKENCQTPVL